MSARAGVGVGPALRASRDQRRPASGSALTNRQAAEVFARILGHPVKFRRLPMPVVRVALRKEFYQMFRWFDGGYEADWVSLRHSYPGIQLTSLEAWLRDDGGEGKRAITVKRDKIGRPPSTA